VDSWFGMDKAKHFAATFGLAAVGYCASGLGFLSRRARLCSGAGIALTAGVAKELDDMAGYGNPSWKDLTWDVVGTCAGLLAALELERRSVRRSAPGAARWLLRLSGAPARVARPT
jgi:putative lipoprotein